MANSNTDFNEINKDAGDLRASLVSITREMTQLISQSSQLATNFGISRDYNTTSRDLAKELSQISEKDLRDKKQVNKLQSLTKELSRKIRADQVELNRLNLLKQNANPVEAAFLNQLIAKKFEEISISQEVLSTSNQLLEVSKNQIGVYDEITKQLKEIKGINDMLSLSFYTLQMLKISKQTADFQKSLLLSVDQARALRAEFVATANASGDTFITVDKLIEANTALGKQLGFNKNFGADLNTEFTNLTKRVGLTEEAASGFAKASIISGKTLKSTAETASGIVSSVSSQYGIQLDIKDVLNEAGTSSAIMLSNFKGSTDALVQGVSQMKALGTSLAQTDKQAASLLDFQSSIENTLKASLFTGREINIEKARELALNNDLTGVAKELSRQQMSFGEFGKMNRIQQEAFAQSLGLSRDVLADQLLKVAVQKKSQSEIIALYGEEAYKRSQTLNAQERFNSAIEKMSDLLGNVMAGPLGKLVDMMASLAENTTLMGVGLGVIAAIQLGSAISQIASFAKFIRLAAISQFIMNALADPFVALGGLAVAAIGGAAITNMLDKSEPANDLMSGYGDRTLVTPQGAYALNNNDTVIAGTNLFKGNDVYSGPKDSINLGGSIDYDKLASAMSRVQVVSQVKISEFANPLTIYQQQNMRRSV